MNIFGNNTNVLQINENKLISSATISNYIIFFDIKNNFEEIRAIKSISGNCCWNSLERIKENIILKVGLIIMEYI